MIIRDPKRRGEIRRLEALVRDNPELFAKEHRRAVLCATGWLALFQALPVVMALVGLAGWQWVDGFGYVTLPLMLAGLFFSWKVARCLVFRLDEGGSLRLDRRTHALLFRDIQEIRRKIDAPKFSSIEFTMEFNAAVSQRPRWFGLLGIKSTLYIGFPMVFCLSRDEFKAVLAHEIAHISRRHSLSHRWPLMVQISVVNIFNYFSGGRNGLIGRVLLHWLDGFMSALVDHGLVAGRLHEREADRIAAGVYGVDICARALTKIAVLAAIYDEDFRESLEERMRTSSFPNACFLEELQRHVDAAVKNPARVRRLLGIELLRTSDLTSSHPSLRERLENIGAVWKGDVSLTGGAAEEYFGRGYKPLAKELDQCWLKVVLPHWGRRHEEYRQIQERLQRKRNIEDSGEKLYGYELLQMAAWSEELGGRRAGLTAYARYHERFPHVDEGRFHYGRLLLSNEDNRGIELLGNLVRENPGYREEGLLAIRAFYERKQYPEGVQWCDGQLETFYGDMEKIMEDRLEHGKDSVFHGHDCPKEFQESVYRLCSEFTQIQRLHLLRKEVQYFKDSPYFVVVVTFNYRVQPEFDRSKILRILRDVMDLSGDFVVMDRSDHANIRARLKRGEFDAHKLYDRDDG